MEASMGHGGDAWVCVGDEDGEHRILDVLPINKCSFSYE